MDARNSLSCSFVSATTNGKVLPAVSVADTLHPDAARASRKRTLEHPGDEHEVRERSASRHEEVNESGSWRSDYLQRKDRETQMIAEGKRVHKPLKQRGNKGFCHECKKERCFKDMSCTTCGHEKCFKCLVVWKD